MYSTMYSESSYSPSAHAFTTEARMHCNLQNLSQFLMQQWPKLTADEIRATRHVKTRLAQLLEMKYGVHHAIAESYLTGIEEHMMNSTLQMA